MIFVWQHAQASAQGLMVCPVQLNGQFTAAIFHADGQYSLISWMHRYGTAQQAAAAGLVEAERYHQAVMQCDTIDQLAGLGLLPSEQATQIESSVWKSLHYPQTLATQAA